MKKQLISILCTLICFCSCTSDLNKVNIDLSEGFEPQVAVTSILNPDSSISLSCLSTYAAYSTRAATTPTISKAILYDITNNTAHNLNQKKRNNIIILSKSNSYPKNGSIYQLVLKTTNPAANIIITDTIPIVKPDITNVKISSIQNTSDFFGTVTFKPIISKKNTYYELVIFRQERGDGLASNSIEPFWQTTLKTSDHIITQEDYYPNQLLLEAEQPQSLLFRLNNNSLVNTINFEYSAGTSYYNSTISSIDNNLRIELRVVSYNYFRYKTTLYKQKYAAEGDLLYGMSAPVKVYSNVSGGVGILGSFCKTDTTVFVEGKTYRN